MLIKSQFRKQSLTSLMQYWWDTYSLSTADMFEEATFQAHLAIGEDMLTRFSEDDPTKDQQDSVIKAFHWSLKADFDSGFKLTTGLSMEALWKALRPIVVSKQQSLDVVLQLEQLAVRFDALRWKASVSVNELGDIMKSLVNAYHLVLISDVDGLSLVSLLDKELENLEANVRREGENVRPFLADQFETLRQYIVLHGGEVDNDTLIYSNYSTASLMRLCAATASSRLFQTIDHLWGSSRGLQPVVNTFSGGKKNHEGASYYSSMMARYERFQDI